MAQWFALRVKSHFEKAVAAAVQRKGFEEFLPLHQCWHQWSDRSKFVELPLFPGYVFCRLDAVHRLALLTIPGVLHIVSFGKIPVAIDDAEITVLRNAMQSRLRLEPWPFQKLGRKVRLGTGPLSGAEGFLIQDQKQFRVVINLVILRQAAAVQIEQDWVES